MTTMTQTTRSKMIALVEMSKTNPNAVEYMYEALRDASDWRDRQIIEHAIKAAIRIDAAR